MKTLIIAALATAALAGTGGIASAQRGPDVVPMSISPNGQPVCPSNYVVRGNACVSIYAGRQQPQPQIQQRGPDAVPITRNYRGELACPSNYVIRGNACVSIYAGGGGGGGGRGGGFEGGFRESYRDDYDRSYRRERHRDEYDAGPSRGRAAVQPWVDQRGQYHCPSNYVVRGEYCVSLY